MTRQILSLILAALYQVLALFFPDIPLSAGDFVEFLLWIFAVLGLVEFAVFAAVKASMLQYNPDGTTSWMLD